MLWRARGVPDWIEADASRQRLFTEETEQLYADARRIRSPADKLLGHHLASNFFRTWVPDLATRLSS